MSMALAQSVALLRAQVQMQQEAMQDILAGCRKQSEALELMHAEITTLRTTLAQVAISRQAPRKEAVDG
jgi:hypothetical protein